VSSRSQTPRQGPPPVPMLTSPDAPFAAPLRDVEEVVDVEYPARARRRRAARIGVTWGAALMMGVAGASAFMSPHGHERSPVALCTGPAPAEEVASAPAATAIAATPSVQVSVAPAPQPAAAVTPPRPAVRDMTASAKAVAATHPRAALHRTGAAPSHGAKRAPASASASAPTKPSSTRRVVRGGGSPTSQGRAPKRSAVGAVRPAR
jgi:hypothetical protein